MANLRAVECAVPRIYIPLALANKFVERRREPLRKRRSDNIICWDRSTYSFRLVPHRKLPNVVVGPCRQLQLVRKAELPIDVVQEVETARHFGIDLIKRLVRGGAE